MSHPKHDQARSFLSIAEDQLGKVLILRDENAQFSSARKRIICFTQKRWLCSQPDLTNDICCVICGCTNVLLYQTWVCLHNLCN